MAAYYTVYVLHSLKIFIIFTFILSLTGATKHGFTVELIHCDSPKSPFYNNSSPLSPLQKLNNAILGSIKRANNLFPKAKAFHDDDDDIVIDAIFNDAQYLMEYSLGSAGGKTRTYGIVDTGSSLVWTQCEPCVNCFKTQAPIFKSFNSTTFRNTSCESPACRSARSISNVTCDHSNKCLYELRYGDGSSISRGEIVADTLTLSSTGGGTVAFPNTVFGCAHDNSGKFPSKTSGVVGLGRGSASLISQMGYAYNGKFSYCLAPFYSDQYSKLSFGQNAVVYGSETISTPIVTKVPNKYYYVTLEGISVGDVRLEYTAARRGNMIIDSGTPLTLLPQDLYYKLEAGVAGLIYPEFPRIQYTGLSLCYEVDNGIRELGAPTITFHFSGADVKLDPTHSFLEVPNSGVVCLAARGDSLATIFGSISMTNFLVGFDLQSNRVSFTPKDCTLL